MMEAEQDISLDSIPKLKVDELKEALRKKNIEFNPKDKKADLANKLREYLEANKSNLVASSESELADNTVVSVAEPAVQPAEDNSTIEENLGNPLISTTSAPDEQTSSEPVANSMPVFDDTESPSSIAESSTLHDVSTNHVEVVPSIAPTQAQEEQRLRELVLRQQLEAKVRSPRGSLIPKKLDATLPTTHVRIDNFQRPWNLRSFQSFLADKIGHVISDQCIWVNAIKTHCYIDFDTTEVAQQCIDAVTGIRYPETSSLLLVANFTTTTATNAHSSPEAQMKPGEWLRPGASRVEASAQSKPNSQSTGATGTLLGRVGGPGVGVDLVRKAAMMAADSAKQAPQLGVGSDRIRPVKHPLENSQNVLDDVVEQIDEHQGKKRKVNGVATIVEKPVEEEQPLRLDDLFKKTGALPALYWMPVSDSEAARRIELGSRYTSLYQVSMAQAIAAEGDKNSGRVPPDRNRGNDGWKPAVNVGGNRINRNRNVHHGGRQGPQREPQNRIRDQR